MPKSSITSSLPTEIHPDQSIALLKALHILTADGKMNQDSRRKLKQVNHLVQFIAPFIARAVAERGRVNIVDHGAGKSYLGFMLHDLALKSLACAHHVYGIETRAPLVEGARALAAKLGFNEMTFLNVSAADALTAPALDVPIDIVTALHACDTATDDAIAFALIKQAKFIVLVPCCQAEIAASLRNVLRGLQLEANGYSVTVTELVGWEHSMKNELILAEFKNLPRKKPTQRLEDALAAFGLTHLRARYLAPQIEIT
jgi:Methyltransferase domain